MQNRPHSQQCPKFHNFHWLIKYHGLLRSASLLFKKLQFYLSWPIQFSTKFSWSHAPASDCVNGTRPQCFTLTPGSLHTEDIVLQNFMCLRFIWLDMLHISIKKSILSSKLISRSKKTHLWTSQLNLSKELFRHTTTRKQFTTCLTSGCDLISFKATK